MGAAVIAALAMAVLATLVLGIVPNNVLQAAESGAHTLQVPPVEIGAPMNPTMPQAQP
jgi:hypothetical protein